MTEKENAFRQLDRANFLIKRARLLIRSGRKVPSSIQQDLCEAATQLILVAGDVKKSANFQIQATREKTRETYLQPIGAEGVLSGDQQKAIEQGPTREYKWNDNRNNRIEYIRTNINRRARLEVAFDASEKKFLVTLFKGQKVYERIKLPGWDKLGVKRLIDHDRSVKVPWKQITTGQTWSAEIEISPYYIDRTWIPQNVVPFRRV